MNGQVKAKDGRALPVPCYPDFTAKHVDHDLYTRISESAEKNQVSKTTIPIKSGQAFEVLAGQTIRVIAAHGPQVVDVNFYNLNNFKEKFYSSKTRQVHQSHLKRFDRLWSVMPWLRPIGTITQDTLNYPLDEFNCSVHDVIGSRCDPYIHRHITGELGAKTCHQNLTEATKKYGLTELDTHDVLNVFMCTGFSLDTGEYICRPSPVKVGDYLEIFAEIDLLVVISNCKHGDVSLIPGDIIPDEICYPIDIVIGQASEDVLKDWKAPEKVVKPIL